MRGWIIFLGMIAMWTIGYAEGLNEGRNQGWRSGVDATIAEVERHVGK